MRVAPPAVPAGATLRRSRPSRRDRCLPRRCLRGGSAPAPGPGGRRRPGGRRGPSSTSAGTSSRSGSFRFGMTTVVTPGPVRRQQLLLDAADGQHPAGRATPQPVIATSGRHLATARQRTARAVVMVTPALGPSLGHGARRYVQVDAALLQIADRHSSSAPRERRSDSAMCARSFITVAERRGCSDRSGVSPAPARLGVAQAPALPRTELTRPPVAPGSGDGQPGRHTGHRGAALGRGPGAASGGVRGTADQLAQRVHRRCRAVPPRPVGALAATQLRRHPTANGTGSRSETLWLPGVLRGTACGQRGLLDDDLAALQPGAATSCGGSRDGRGRMVKLTSRASGLIPVDLDDRQSRSRAKRSCGTASATVEAVARIDAIRFGRTDIDRGRNPGRWSQSRVTVAAPGHTPNARQRPPCGNRARKSGQEHCGNHGPRPAARPVTLTVGVTALVKSQGHTRSQEAGAKTR